MREKNGAVSNSIRNTWLFLSQVKMSEMSFPFYPVSILIIVIQCGDKRKNHNNTTFTVFWVNTALLCYQTQQTVKIFFKQDQLWSNFNLTSLFYSCQPQFILVLNRALQLTHRDSLCPNQHIKKITSLAEVINRIWHDAQDTHTYIYTHTLQGFCSLHTHTQTDLCFTFFTHTDTARLHYTLTQLSHIAHSTLDTHRDFTCITHTHMEFHTYTHTQAHTGHKAHTDYICIWDIQDSQHTHAYCFIRL